MTRLALPSFALSLVIATLVACSGSPPPSGNTGNTAPPAGDAPADTTPPPSAPPAGDDNGGDGDTATTIPARFHGEWNSNLPHCGAGNNESRLTVDATTLRFYEATGQVKSTRVDGNALSVDTTLSGEGVTRDKTFNYTLSADGNTLTDTGDGLVRQRCGG